jgi:hypothetical protein
MPAGWTIQQITHCSASLACSDSLANHSSAAAVGEADLTSVATIVKQARKTTQATAIVSTATITRQAAKTATATAATTATITRQIGKRFSAAPATAATIVKRVGKALGGTPVTTSATLTPQYLHLGVTNPQALSASVAATASLTAFYVHNPVSTPQTLTVTITTVATIGTVKVTPVTAGRDQQDIGVLVAAVGGGIGV